MTNMGHKVFNLGFRMEKEVIREDGRLMISRKMYLQDFMERIILLQMSLEITDHFKLHIRLIRRSYMQ